MRSYVLCYKFISPSGGPKPTTALRKAVTPIYQTTRHHAREDRNVHWPSYSSIVDRNVLLQCTGNDTAYYITTMCYCSALAMILRTILLQYNENHVSALKKIVLLYFTERVKATCFDLSHQVHLQVHLIKTSEKSCMTWTMLKKELATLRSFYAVSVLCYTVSIYCTVSILCYTVSIIRMLQYQYTMLQFRYTTLQCQYFTLHKTVQTVYISPQTCKLYPTKVGQCKD